jgi:hypothetical protein
MHDGGTPIHGLARGIDEEHWDEIARRFLLSDQASPDLKVGPTLDVESVAGRTLS